MTLLDMVRSILSSMNSDDVDRHDLTTESMRVAEILRDTYFELMAARDWKSKKRLIQFEHSGDPERPNYLKAPDNLEELVLLEYSNTPLREGVMDYQPLKYLTNEAFLRKTAYIGKIDTRNVREVIDPSGVRFSIITNKAPEYWTTFDDKHIVTDSYDKSLDDALQVHKTRAVGFVGPEWKMEDDFVPELPLDAFPALLEEARSTSFFNIKQMVNDKAEQKAIRHRRRMSQKSWTLEGGIQYPNYGRRRVK